MGEESGSQKEYVPRIGTFLILLGIFFFILFLASDFADRPDFDWLFLGVILVALGFLLRRRATPPPPAGRFGALRRLRESTKKRKEERAKKAKKK
jgi:hypothetical protein